MTSIILVIVGILLAAAAALMVVFYGGDAYNSGNARAAAVTIVNAGENVRHAVALYRLQEGTDPTDPQALVTGGYLQRIPEIGSLGRAAATWRTVAAADGTRPSYVIDDVDGRICAEINRRHAGGRHAGDERPLTGCIEDGGRHTYYMRIGGW